MDGWSESGLMKNLGGEGVERGYISIGIMWWMGFSELKLR